MGECFSHIQKWVDYALAFHETGISTRYHGSCKQKQPRNRRLPNSTLQLVGRKSREPGHFKRSWNVSPSKNVIMDFRFGVPWSYWNKEIKVSYACAMDSVLISLYLVKRFEIVPIQFIMEQCLWSFEPYFWKEVCSIMPWVLVKSWNWLGYSNSICITALVYAIVVNPLLGQNLVYLRKQKEFKDLLGLLITMG